MGRLSVETWDLDEAAAILREQFTAAFASPDAPAGLQFTQDSLNEVLLTQISYFMDAHFVVDEPARHTYITHLRSGLLSYHMDSTRQINTHENRWVAGDVFVAAGADSTFTTDLRHADAEFAMIDPATFAAVAQTADGSPVALTGYTPISAEAARSWLFTFEFAQQVAAQPVVTPLIAATTARLLAATALATFPNNALTDPTIEDRHDAHPPTVRRAVAFIESHPDLDLSVVDIARAAFVTPRALQLAFRRHLDTTPQRYLRRVRLDRAHADLQAADPAVDTVTAVAARWGWARPSRFATDYRAAFGRHPHQTLRS